MALGWVIAYFGFRKVTAAVQSRSVAPTARAEQKGHRRPAGVFHSGGFTQIDTRAIINFGSSIGPHRLAA